MLATGTCATLCGTYYYSKDAYVIQKAGPSFMQAP